MLDNIKDPVVREEVMKALEIFSQRSSAQTHVSFVNVYTYTFFLQYKTWLQPGPFIHADFRHDCEGALLPDIFGFH